MFDSGAASGKRSKWSIVAGLAATIAVLFFPATARADFEEKAYEDIKQLVEELITAEVAQSVVPNLVCRAPQVLDHYPRSLQRIYDRQFSALKASLHDETAVVIAYQILVALDPRFKETAQRDKGQTFLLKGMEGGPAGTTKATAPPKGAPTPEKTDDDDEAVELADCVVEEIETLAKADGGKCQERVGQCFRARHYATFDAKSLATKCLDGTQTLTESQQVSCAFALAAEAGMQGRLDAAELQLVNALGLILADASATKLNAQAKLPQARLKIVSLVRDLVLGRKLSTAEIQSEVAKAFGVEPAAVTAVVEAIERIQMQWATLTSPTVKLTLPTFVSSVAGLGSPLAELCRDNAAPSCELPKRMHQAFSAGGQAFPLFRAFQRLDYREIATLIIRDVFDRYTPVRKLPEDPTFEERRRLFRLYRQFTEAVAAYVLDVALTGEQSVGARVAFKDAAFDVVREVASGKSSGFDRSFARKILVPDFSMRVTYSSSFINEAGGDGIRIAPTVDWLNLRGRVRYTEYLYVGVQASLIDLAGPFSEAALRRDEEYLLGGRMWAQFARPRAEVMLGLPALSKKLAATVGVSMRTTTPIARTDTATGAPARYEYRWFFEKTEPGYVSDIARFTELSIAIKYVP